MIDEQGFFSVAIAPNSFRDLNGWLNPEGSGSLWYDYDSILPAVLSVVPNIAITPYINDVTLNSTVFTITFGEAPFSNFTASCVQCINCAAKSVTKVSPTVYTFKIFTFVDSTETAVRLPWVRLYSLLVLDCESWLMMIM